MLSILINAYACSPGMGSEPGMAWNWCVNLANYCKLYIITEGEFREKIEEVLPTLPQGKNMHFFYNPVSDKIRKMCWNQGDWRFYKHYKKWQWKTYKIALDIIPQYHIDIVHQLNMIGFREPGYLWKLSEEIGIPFVWGPVDAKEKFPISYLDGVSIKQKVFIRLKNILTGLQLKYSNRVKNAVFKATYVVSASSESQKSLRKYFHKDSLLLNETGCYLRKDKILPKKRFKDSFDLLWVGKLDVRKQLNLAIRTLAFLSNRNIRLHIVGSGDTTQYKLLAEKLGIKDLCIWHGVVNHNRVQQIMQESDLFFFTSVAEGTPHVVLESISNGLPVLCFNCCGQGDSVNGSVGMKIELSTPQQSICEFADKITYLYHHRDKLEELSDNCKIRQQELSWEEKAKKMVDLYQMTVK